MPEITETELKKQIEKSDFSNLYVLYGEESYLVSHYAQKLIAKAKGTAFEDFNLQRFEGDTVSMDTLAEAVEALPFMAERKCVAVSDLDVEGLRAAELSKLEQIVDSIPPSTVLVLYLPCVAIDLKTAKKWKKFLAAANQKGNTVLFKRRSNPDLEKLLCSGASKRGCELSRQDAGRMIRAAGNDLQTLTNELEKLCAFVGEGKITPQVIDQLVAKNLEARVYDLSKAILSGQYDRAYEILDLLFYQNEEPVSVLAVLSSAYIDLYRVRVSVQSGYSALEPAKHFDYARKEFRLTNAERDSKRLSTAMLRESLRVLLEADMALKGARGDRRIVMEKLLAQLLYISEREKTA
ncbi:DNA polymerase III subunit delta [Caproiciproducens sp. LBM24188]|nr:DNA polymerase III subunit delta [Oscillospiraceae bacterium]HHV32939.1 DNA polymerase III subunit delta [Clostridiales bacterium]